MYVCMYVGMYVYMYVCMHVFMYACMNVCMYFYFCGTVYSLFMYGLLFHSRQRFQNWLAVSSICDTLCRVSVAKCFD